MSRSPSVGFPFGYRSDRSAFENSSSVGKSSLGFFFFLSRKVRTHQICTSKPRSLRTDGIVATRSSYCDGQSAWSLLRQPARVRVSVTLRTPTSSSTSPTITRRRRPRADARTERHYFHTIFFCRTEETRKSTRPKQQLRVPALCNTQ